MKRIVIYERNDELEEDEIIEHVYWKCEACGRYWDTAEECAACQHEKDESGGLTLARS